VLHAAYLDGARVTQNHFTDCQARMTVTQGLPLRFFDDPEVQRSYFCLLPQSRDTNLAFGSKTGLSNNIIRLSESCKEKIKEEFKSLENNSGIGLAIDGWSQKHNRTSYLCVKAFWVAQVSPTRLEWRERLLGFPGIGGNHEGSYLGKLVKDICEWYGILDRIRSVTADNASENGTLVQEMNKADESKD
jgi:hypothetical protein